MTKKLKNVKKCLENLQKLNKLSYENITKITIKQRK